MFESRIFGVRAAALNMVSGIARYGSVLGLSLLFVCGASLFAADTVRSALREVAAQGSGGYSSLVAVLRVGEEPKPVSLLTNKISTENSLPGNPKSEWDVAGSGDANIQGFSTDISVDLGQTVDFKIDTGSTDYRLDIYRMGYYGGLGARKISTVQPSATLPQSQPSCLTDAATGLVDCGNWAVSASWSVPAAGTSGIYFAKLVREDGTSGASHIFFVVRDDAGSSELLFQTADTTWQAYNRYGGNSLYTGSPAGRAYKVSYNRPFTTRGYASEDGVFNSEYPMVRWLERNGYDVSYTTGVDSDRRGAELLEHKIFLSVGHDEYWSGTQRANVTAARNAGVNLAFFSGNEVFWKTRWESSIDATGTSHRTLVCYKETSANAKIDPSPEWTGTWRDPRFSPPSDAGRPENELTGTAFMVNSGTTNIKVPEADGKLRLWRNTSVATQAPGDVVALGSETLGYEWDSDLDNGARPAGLIRLSTTTLEGAEVLQDYGSTYAVGTATHHLTLYRKDNPGTTPDALVFGAGTVQWSWGLDSEHDRGSAPADVRMQQATVNLFADMGAQPASLQAGLTAASMSTDTAAPNAAVTSPAEGSTVPAGNVLHITGTAADTGGLVGAVEVSVDGGLTWRPATGRQDWTYSWTPSAQGPATIKARAVDDSGNLQALPQTINVTVGPAGPVSCPCSIFSPSTTGNQVADSSAVELGVKFRSDVSGFISGIRFYKTAGNTGTHTGRLWNAEGTSLGTVTFSPGSPTGWQEATFSSPIAISANTTYVASYHTTSGNYALSTSFASAGVDNPPVHALQNGVDGPNGVFRYGSGGIYPTDSFNSGNYLVDVVFVQSSGPDVTPPTITARSPLPNATGVEANSNITGTFSEAMDASTINGATLELRDTSSDSIIPSSVTYDATGRLVTLDPTGPLSSSTTYTARIKGGVSGVKDVAGNALAADGVWSFTTAAPPPDDGPGGPILVISSGSNPFSRYYAEILRAEGLNAFLVKDISTVSAATLTGYQVVILGDIPLTAAQATMLGDWVNAGGNLIAMRPDADLASLLGLTRAETTLANGYLLVDTSTESGNGIVNQTIQYHGTADRYSLNGATAVANLYSDATTAAGNPAVTIRNVGSNGGQAAAFTFDLARSVVYTRQGNPAWAGDERDGESGPIRANDMFFGAKAGDVQPDWVDLNKVAIPQADEQQRLLANLITKMNLDRMPLPRFWYFPKALKAVVIMTGDDHGNGGTGGQFEAFRSASPAGCSVDDWECIRATSYVYPGTSISNPAAYQAEGFEIGLHVSTSCGNYTPQSLAQNYSEQLTSWTAAYPGVTAPVTNRTHCIAWSDWATQPAVELAHGIRLDTNYYYWPGSWVLDRPGMFTGSGIPMRFANLDGSIIDVYQAATQLTDESNQTLPTHIQALLTKANGPEGYYGAFTANMHTDTSSHAGANAIVASAQSHGIPVISAKQMLTWLDGRNSSSFTSMSWNPGSLSFTVNAAPGARNLNAMLPAVSGDSTLTSLTRGGSPVTYTTQTIKGIQYALFPSVSGNYLATYTSDTTAPTVTGIAPANAATNVDVNANVSATFSEAMDAATITTATVQLLDPSSNPIAATVSYDPATNTATLDAGSPLAHATVYTAKVKGGATGAKDSAGIPLAADYTWSFTTAAATVSNCPCSIWPDSTVPGQPAVSDSVPIEVGVKFRASVSGYITGVQFYKGSANTGTHIGHLWTSSGTMLAEATFINETASGWQTVEFSSPVAISADTTYVVSYHSPSGYFAIDPGYFSASGVTSGPLTALQSGVDGPNGVYKYGPSSFPNDPGSNTANYWVDPIFDDDVSDTTAPTILGRDPAPQAIGVNTTANISVQFSEPMNASTINGSTFRLRREGLGSDVTATISYANSTATLDPSFALTADAIYRVTVTSGVTDTAGNPLGGDSTWTFTTAANGFTDTTVNDFGAGTIDANTIVTQTGDGEVIIRPLISEEFSGSEVPAGWNITTWASDGVATVGLGQISVDAAIAKTDALFAPGRSIEFKATFGAAPFQHAGFADDLNDVPLWAIFSTKDTSTTLFARTNNGSSSTDVPIPGSWTGAPHRYRIEWNATNVVFYIDGNAVSTQSVSIGSPMRPAISDLQSGGQSLSVDWLRMSPSAPGGVFTSRIFDAGDTADWTVFAMTAVLPAGTSITVETRTGDTPAPDGTWSVWQPLTGSTINSPNGRLIQYRALLTTSSDSVSPELQNVTISFDPVLSPTAAPVDITGRIVDSTGRPVFGAVVTVSDGSGVVKIGRSNPFGYYRVKGLPAGASYIFQVSAKGKMFALKFVSVVDDIADLNFVAEPN